MWIFLLSTVNHCLFSHPSKKNKKEHLKECIPPVSPSANRGVKGIDSVPEYFISLDTCGVPEAEREDDRGHDISFCVMNGGPRETIGWGKTELQPFDIWLGSSYLTPWRSQGSMPDQVANASRGKTGDLKVRGDWR